MRRTSTLPPRGCLASPPAARGDRVQASAGRGPPGAPSRGHGGGGGRRRCCRRRHRPCRRCHRHRTCCYRLRRCCFCCRCRCHCRVGAGLRTLHIISPVWMVACSFPHRHLPTIQAVTPFLSHGFSSLFTFRLSHTFSSVFSPIPRPSSVLSCPHSLFLFPFSSLSAPVVVPLSSLFPPFP